MNMSKGAQQYAKVDRNTAVENANPHQLIQMLYQGALDSLQQSLGYIDRRDFEAKGKSIGRAITIIGGLQGFLDHEKGGAVSANLDSLYEYMTVKLFEATRENSAEKVREVIGLLRQIKTGWDGISEEASRIFSESAQPATR
ncbi:MAG TPA: flagellar export chaperone FliS [Dongiaceae bacterium]|nr:flagellar export chaperone FliS [Dongiaceae bacterium]